MKIFSQNAAILLFNKMESLRQKPRESWRSVYLKLPDKQTRHNNDLRTHFIVNAISELLADMDGYVYLCDDGDIFILFQGASRPILARLSRHFGDLDPQQLRGQPQSSLFSIFDLGKHWEGFYKLCEAKYRAASATPEELRAGFIHYPHPASVTERI
jgi:acylphosphatase